MKSLVLLGKVLFWVVLSLLSQNVEAQSREYIRKAIRSWGECRNVAITKSNGDLALYGRNGWARTGCPQSLNEALDELNEEKTYIDDVQLTEEGRWLILVDDNGFRWNDIPIDLERKLRYYNNEGEVVTSVTFNDAGNWIVITTEHISASNSEVQKWLMEGIDEFGKLWAACVTDDAIVAVFARGYKFVGNVPESLKTALKQTTLNVYRLKVAGTSWFFADKDGSYQYSM